MLRTGFFRLTASASADEATPGAPEPRPARTLPRGGIGPAQPSTAGEGGASERAPLDPAAGQRAGGPAPGDRIDLKLLVIAASKSDPDFAAIVATLERLGARYDTLLATEERLTEERLWHDAHAHYQGVIVAAGNLRLWNGESRSWSSPIDEVQWETLRRFEARFGIRRVTCSGVPGGPDDVGLALAGALDTSSAPAAVSLTDAGREVFFYLNPATPIALRYAWTYLGQPIDDSTAPLLVTPGGQAVGAIRRHPDGREHLALTMVNGPHLLHSLLLGYGVVNWVTRGLFLGARHVYLSPQVDDIFFRTRLWDPEVGSDRDGPIHRIDGEDVGALIDWLDRTQRRTRNAAGVTFEFAFNGEGALHAPPDDTLLPALVPNQARFAWVNHTFRHALMDDVTYEAGLAEIYRNDEAAHALGLQRYHADSMVTPEFSGLKNPAFLRAARDAGIRYLICDTSRLEGESPAPNTGITCSHEPDLLVVPRHPTNLFFNVSTPAEWVSEYNQMYRSFWKADLSYEDILDREADIMLQYLLKFDVDPVMFHQSNLRAYDGARSLVADLIDTVLTKYNALYGDVPIRSLSLHEIGELMAARATYRAARIEAMLVRGGGVRLVADREVVVPMTGVRAGAGAETYAGQTISSVSLAPDEPRWLPPSTLLGHQTASPAVACAG